MDVDRFWAMVEDARSGVSDLEARADEVIAARLVTRLTSGGPAAVLAFNVQWERAQGSLHRWDVWAAAYLIGQGCGDDRFSDFCAGVVGLGRMWHARVLDNPDDLADHPLVQRAAAEGDTDAVFSEPLNYVASTAYEQITGDDEAFFEALEASRRGADDVGSDRSEMGEEFDFDNHDEVRRRLPRLAELLLGPGRPAANQ